MLLPWNEQRVPASERAFPCGAFHDVAAGDVFCRAVRLGDLATTVAGGIEAEGNEAVLADGIAEERVLVSSLDLLTVTDVQHHILLGVIRARFVDHPDQALIHAGIARRGERLDSEAEKIGGLRHLKRAADGKHFDAATARKATIEYLEHCHATFVGMDGGKEATAGDDLGADRVEVGDVPALAELHEVRATIVGGRSRGRGFARW